VVGAEVRIGVDLFLKQRFRQPAVRLVAFDDERTGWKRSFLQLELAGRAADLDTLHAQQVDQPLDARRIALPGGNDVAGDRLPAAGLGRVPRLDVKVLEDDRGELRRVLERGEDAGLAVVRVVSERPVELARRRPGPVPLPLALVAAPCGDGPGIGGGSRASRRGLALSLAPTRLRRCEPQLLRV